MVQLANQERKSQDTRKGFRKARHSDEEIPVATTAEFDVDPEEYVGFRSKAAGRDATVYFCRRCTTATLAELSAVFGLPHRDSSGDLVKRAQRSLESN